MDASYWRENNLPTAIALDATFRSFRRFVDGMGWDRMGWNCFKKTEKKRTRKIQAARLLTIFTAMWRKEEEAHGVNFGVPGSK